MKRKAWPSVSARPRIEIRRWFDREDMTQARNGGEVHPIVRAPGVGTAIEFIHDLEQAAGRVKIGRAHV